MSKYYDEFKDRQSILDQTNYGAKLPSEDEIVYAGYTYEDYSGSALIVFVRDGQWYENNDGHCSYFGLEGWGPEATLPEAVLKYTHWPGLAEAVTERLARE